MNPYIIPIIVLAIALYMSNRKEIATYIAWLKFKIKMDYKHRQNERRNNTSKGSRGIHG